MDNASPEKVVRCCGLPNRICLFVKNKCAAQVLCGCSPWLPWRTLRMWGALIAYFSPIPGFTKAQSFPIIRTADENANTLSTTREDINYPNVKLDHEKSPFIDGFLGLMFFTWCEGYLFHLIQCEHISVSFLTDLTASWYEMHLPPSDNSELVCHSPPSPMVTACHLFTRLNASWNLWTKYHKVCTWRCAAVLHWALLPALFMSTIGLESVSCFCIIKNVWCSGATGNTNRATASCLLEMHFFFFFWGDDFHWRPLQDQQTFPAFILHKHIHGFIWKVSKVNWG